MLIESKGIAVGDSGGRGGGRPGEGEEGGVLEEVETDSGQPAQRACTIHHVHIQCPSPTWYQKNWSPGLELLSEVPHEPLEDYY